MVSIQKDNVIFLRGTGQDSTTKTLNLMGHKLYQQQYWIKGSVLVEMLSKKDLEFIRSI